MTNDEIGLIISGIGVIASSAIAIILGIFSYRLSKKQIETDQKIAEMQKEMHDKEMKINLFNQRLECYNYINYISDIASELFMMTNRSYGRINLFGGYWSNLRKFKASDLDKINIYTARIKLIFSDDNKSKLQDLELSCSKISDTLFQYEISKCNYPNKDKYTEIEKYLEDIKNESNNLKKICTILNDDLSNEIKIFDEVGK